MMTSHGWFDVVRFPAGVTMIAEPGHEEDVKSYLVEGDEYVAVLDTGMGIGDLKRLTEQLSDRPPIVLLSHGVHLDHVGGAHQYPDVRVHPSEAEPLRAGVPNEVMREILGDDYLRGVALPDGLDPMTASIPGVEPTGYLEEGDVIDLGGRQLHVYHTPGHSPGGITLIDREQRLMFAGDTLYAGAMFPHVDVGGDPGAYRVTLRRLAGLSEQVDTIYPSHGRVPLVADDARRMHAAFEEIWSGTKAPDAHHERFNRYVFEDFQFLLPPDFEPL
jgi:glyoxylase-like metal-dependent hydrolase (beta-lactamase superfamily II)